MLDASQISVPRNYTSAPACELGIRELGIRAAPSKSFTSISGDICGCGAKGLANMPCFRDALGHSRQTIT